MKKNLLVFFALFLFVFGKAQYVTIPDSVFVLLLQQYYPNCMNGNQMDTTCAAITQAFNTPPFFQGSYVENLMGIQFFDSLEVLTLDYMDSLHLIPAFPPALRFLYILQAPLDSLPPLPETLETVSINVTNITIPPVIPSGATILLFDNSPLAYAPNLPSGLISLSLSYCSLLSIPPLPPQLIDLSVANNQLSSIPQIPSSLQFLRFEMNQVTSLPALPNTLRQLIFSNNLISSIGALPDSLQILFCQNNLITCFPTLPDIPGFIGMISGNANTCLPNYASWMAVQDPQLLSIPLCNPSNPSGCPVLSGVSGRVYNDSNANCVSDTGEVYLQNIPFLLFDTAGILLEQAGSFQSGSFYFTPDTGQYIIRLDTSVFSLASVVCPAGISRNVSLSVSSPSAFVADFDLQCVSGYDPGVQSLAYNGLVFPGQPHWVSCTAGDLLQWYGLPCGSSESGQIKLTVTGPVSFLNSPPGYPVPQVNGDTLIYSVTDFANFQTVNGIAFQLTTDTLAQIGDTVCIDVAVSGTGNDLDTSNNHFTLCYAVSNSYDPNKKEVYPSQVAPGYTDWFTYTVHFQNNGTAPAITIGINDTLSTMLDVTSLEMLGGSHAFTYSVIGHRLWVHFPNIYLTDSATNYAASQGWFQFRIKPAGSYPAGTSIPNSAAIYFDFNAPIITNTAFVNYPGPIGMAEPVAALPLRVFPNPAGETITAATSLAGSADLRLYSPLGQELLAVPVTSTATAIDLRSFAAGVYVLELRSGNVVRRERVIVAR